MIKPRAKSVPLDELSQQVLRSIGAHRCSFAEIIEEQFLAPGTGKAFLSKLERSGFVENAELAPGLGCYSLTPSACTQLGLPASRGRIPEPRGLWEALAVLWFCCRSQKRRYRLETGHLQTIFRLGAKERIQTPHCIEPDTSRPRLYRVYVPGQTTPDSEVMSTIREHVESCNTDERYQTGIRKRYYALAVVVDTPGRQQKLFYDVKQARLFDELSILIEHWPGLDRLKEALSAGKPDKQLRANSGARESCIHLATEPDRARATSLSASNAGNGARVSGGARKRTGARSTDSPAST